MASQQANSQPIWSQLWVSLSVWDYIFGTHHIPHDGRDIELGFDGDESFPEDFINQELYPLSKDKI